MSKVTKQELELETAELLPARETLNCYRGPSSHTTYNFQSGNGNYDGNGDGNGNFGLIVISGNGDGDLNGLTFF